MLPSATSSETPWRARMARSYITSMSVTCRMGLVMVAPFAPDSAASDPAARRQSLHQQDLYQQNLPNSTLANSASTNSHLHQERSGQMRALSRARRSRR